MTGADITVECGSTSFVEPGFSAIDEVEGDLTSSVIVDSSAIDFNTPGDYIVTYNVSDTSGNAPPEEERTVTVEDSTAPILALSGGAATVECGATAFTESGFSAIDACEGDLTGAVAVDDSAINFTTPGDYLVIYNVSDSAGNAAATQTRIVTVEDTTLPTIGLAGGDVTLVLNATFTDEGATASDNCDGDLGTVAAVGTVDTTTAGEYTLTYDIADAAGNDAQQVTRTVTVVAGSTPTITLLGDSEVTVECGSAYSEPGFTAEDTEDGTITNDVEVSSDIDAATPGSYTVTYTVTDSSGNAAPVQTRTVTVEDTTAPTITLSGGDVAIRINEAYTDLGATADDACEGDLGSLTAVGTVDNATLGEYVLTYDIADAVGNNATQVTRTVTVILGEAPVISLLGDSEVTVECSGTYVEPGFSAEDTEDGDISEDVAITSTVDATAPGSYTVRYNVTDSSGNPATEAVRTVIVQDTTLPTLTLEGGAVVVTCDATGFVEPGFSAADACAGGLTGSVDVDDSGVVYGVPGTYALTYTVSDGTNATQVTRSVTVEDTDAPTISLVGSTSVSLFVGDTYVEQGATVFDGCEGNISGNLEISGDLPVDTSAPGTFVLRYNASDTSGNAANEVTRTVTILDNAAPVITITGGTPLTLCFGESYVDQGATATDDTDGTVTVDTLSNNVNTGAIGDYEVLYQAEDSTGNSTTATRVVLVRDSTAPVITLIGDSVMTLLCGQGYLEPGAMATDECDASVVDTTVGGEIVNVNDNGVYIVTYTATDAAGNTATATRTVTVSCTGVTTSAGLASELAEDFDDVDNGDGQLSISEARLILQGLTEDRFNELDLDSNGFLTRDELNTTIAGPPNRAGCYVGSGAQTGGPSTPGDLAVMLMALASLVLSSRIRKLTARTRQ